MARPASKAKSTANTPAPTNETPTSSKLSRSKKQTGTESETSRPESTDKTRKPILINRKINVPDTPESTAEPKNPEKPSPLNLTNVVDSPSETGLKGVLAKVTAHVHVNTDDNVDASDQFIKQLEGMGAKIRKTLCLECTHLVVQNPSKSLQTRFRNLSLKAGNGLQLENKLPSTKKPRKRPDPSQLPIPVNILWLDACQKQQELVEESEYLVDLTKIDILASNSKRKKPMQPTKVTHADVCDGRFSSSQPSVKEKGPFVSDSTTTLPSVFEEIDTPSKKADNTKAKKRPLVEPGTVDKDNEDGDIDRESKTTASISQNATNTKDESADLTDDNATVEKINGKPKSSGKRRMETVSKGPPVTENSTPTALHLSKKRKSPVSLTNARSPSVAEAKKTVSNAASPSGAEAKKAVRKAKRFIVMTNVEKQTRDVVISTIRKLGTFKLAERVDSNTTHVITGDTRRTMSIVKGIARGCWVVSPEWIYRSLENEQWQNEAPFELSEAFPAALQARTVVHGLCEKALIENPDDDDIRGGDGRVPNSQGFLSGVQVFIGDTDASREEVAELVAYMGGFPVTSVSTADLGIGKGIAQRRWSKKEVVEERWLYDSITEFRRLPYNDYLITAREKADESDEELVGSPQF